MNARSKMIDLFLDAAGWADATRTPLAGDASNRRYERIRDPAAGRQAVLMDAAPERGEDTRPFAAITAHLRSAGLSAPRIYAHRADRGLMLLEDLGDALFARVLDVDPAQEATLYAGATDTLIHLQAAPAPQLAHYDTAFMTEMAALAFQKYAGPLTAPDPGAETRFRAVFADILNHSIRPDDGKVLILRDYHAENLLWLPERRGVARVGLLDYQDAMLGHPAYDLVSLLQDARRDVSPETAPAMIGRYIAATGCDAQAFRTAYAVLGVQRNLRILGVFGRLCTDYAKPQYVNLIPRVWDHLMQGLEHPALAQVNDLLRSALPVPDADALNRLRESAGQ